MGRKPRASSRRERRMHSRRVVLAGGAAALASGCVPASGPLTVFAAASLQESLSAAGAAWTATSETPVRFVFGASSAIARQIHEGAPADVMVSADEDWMDWLAARGGIVPATRRRLLSNRLVLIAPAESMSTLKVAPGIPLATSL